MNRDFWINFLRKGLTVSLLFKEIDCGSWGNTCPLFLG